MYFDMSSGVAGPLGSRENLQCLAMILHRVVPGHPTHLLEAKHAVDVESRIQLTIGLFRLRCRYPKAFVEARQEFLEDAVGFVDGSGTRQPQLRYQPILEGPVGSLNTSLRLRAAGKYLSDTSSRIARPNCVGLLVSTTDIFPVSSCFE